MQLQVFNNMGFEIRGGLIDDKPYFVAMDIARALEYSETAMMLRRLDDDEIMQLSADLAGGFSKHASKITIINESGLYNAILGSKKPQAKQFKKWVTSEVLPSIRKYGFYLTPNVESTLIEELKVANLSKDSLKSENEALKEELLQAQRELISFYKTQRETLKPRSRIQKHPLGIITQIQSLAKEGQTTSQIASKLNISKSSVRKYKEGLC